MVTHCSPAICSTGVVMDVKTPGGERKAKIAII